MNILSVLGSRFERLLSLSKKVFDKLVDGEASIVFRQRAIS